MDLKSDVKHRLAGRRVIVTRAPHQAVALASRLESLGAEVIHIPTIEICPPLDWTPVDNVLESLEVYDWIVFTSANAVDFFLQRFDEKKLERRLLGGRRFAVVGSQTRRRLEDQGLSVDLQPAVFTSSALVSEFLSRYRGDEELRGVRLLVPTSSISRDIIRSALAGNGAIVDIVEVYRTTCPSVEPFELRSRLNASDADSIVFASPSAIQNLERMLGHGDFVELLSRLRVVCIGPVTKQAAQRLGVNVAAEPGESTVEAIVSMLVEEH